MDGVKEKDEDGSDTARGRFGRMIHSVGKAVAETEPLLFHKCFETVHCAVEGVEKQLAHRLHLS